MKKKKREKKGELEDSGIGSWGILIKKIFRLLSIYLSILLYDLPQFKDLNELLPTTRNKCPPPINSLELKITSIT